MYNIVMNGTVKKWEYDWRVLEHVDTNGRRLAYTVERNQGDHDQRYFLVKLTFDKDEAIKVANRLFVGR